MNTKTLLRYDVRYEIDKVLTERFKDGIQPNCVNCSLFNEDLETCTKFNQRPPARIIALGCEHHEDKNDIPF